MSNIAVANGVSSCTNISLILILLGLDWRTHKLLQGHTPFQYQVIGFPTQVNVTICLVIGSRKPSDQLASNIYINVMPISIALSKVISCNDIILLVVHFFREEIRSLESSKILVENFSLCLFLIWIVTLASIVWRPYPVLRKNVG